MKQYIFTRQRDRYGRVYHVREILPDSPEEVDLGWVRSVTTYLDAAPIEPGIMKWYGDSPGYNWCQNYRNERGELGTALHVVFRRLLQAQEVASVIDTDLTWDYDPLSEDSYDDCQRFRWTKEMVMYAMSMDKWIRTVRPMPLGLEVPLYGLVDDIPIAGCADTIRVNDIDIKGVIVGDLKTGSQLAWKDYRQVSIYAILAEQMGYDVQGAELFRPKGGWKKEPTFQHVRLTREDIQYFANSFANVARVWIDRHGNPPYESPVLLPEKFCVADVLADPALAVKEEKDGGDETA